MTKTPEPAGLNIVSYDSGDEKASALVAAFLGAEIAARFGSRDEAPLAIYAHHGDALAGGLIGCTHWGWLYVRHFWVAPDWRGRGVGRSLLRSAEMEAQARDCVGVYLDTFDPAAAEFYARRGFLPCGRIEDFPPGHARLFLHKKLPAR